MHTVIIIKFFGMAITHAADLFQSFPIKVEQWREMHEMWTKRNSEQWTHKVHNNFRNCI